VERNLKACEYPQWTAAPVVEIEEGEEEEDESENLEREV
jgi:hypothetical protein